MKTSLVTFVALCLLYPAGAMASFTYVPASAPEAPIIKETAKEAAQGAAIVPAADLSLPGSSAAERAKAERELAKAREALRQKELAAAKRWEAMEKKAGRPTIPPDTPAPLPPTVDVTEIVITDNGPEKKKPVNIAPTTPPAQVVQSKPIEPVSVTQGITPIPATTVNSTSAQQPVIVNVTEQIIQPAPQPVPVRPEIQAILPATTIQPIPAAPMVPAVEALVISKGSLKDQLTKYAEKNGYQVSWNYPDDLIVTNSTTFSTGSFTGNMRELFTTLQYIGRRDIQATLFQGNNTIVIEPSRR